MKHSAFNDPQPKDLAEMEEALTERDVDATDCCADISFLKDEADEVFNGYSAEVKRSDDGENVFTTLGYARKESLISDLEELGITDINDDTDDEEEDEGDDDGSEDDEDPELEDA